MNPDSTEDRLSSLPKNIIESILICLPLRDAVRTSILAHAWRYEWSNVPQLIFDEQNFPLSEPQIDYDTELSKIIDQALLLHQGPIHKFELSTKLKCCMDIGKWILFVSRNGIREFILRIWKGLPYKVPSCLFLCEEMTHLELYRCILAPPASFNGFNNLRTLDLWGVGFSNDGFDNLISNCPLLNQLKLRDIVDCTCLKIHSPKLVDLYIGGKFIDLSFDKTPALAKVSISWNADPQSVENGALCKLTSLLGSLPSIKTLKLFGHTLPILSAGDVPVSLPDLCQLSELSVCINFEDMQEVLAVLCIFRSSPLLKRVGIWAYSDFIAAARIRTEDFWEEHDDFKCLFSVLQFISVTGYTGTITELKFIEFVLANAPVLETVKIQLKENIADVLKIYRQLIRIRRISPKVEILIPEEAFLSRASYENQ